MRSLLSVIVLGAIVFLSGCNLPKPAASPSPQVTSAVTAPSTTPIATLAPLPSAHPSTIPSTIPSAIPSTIPIDFASHTHQWMIGQWTVPALESDAAANAALAGAQPIVILTTSKTTPTTYPKSCPAPAAWQPICVYRYTSEVTFANDVMAHVIPSYLGAVMYDNELHTQPATPLAEQENPPFYVAKFAEDAHSVGLGYIQTAGLHVAGNYPGGAAKEVADLYQTAKLWDCVALQTQTAELDLSRYAALMLAQIDAARKVNPQLNCVFTGVGNVARDSSGNIVPVTSLSALQAAIGAVPVGWGEWVNVGAQDGLPSDVGLEVQLVDAYP